MFDQHYPHFITHSGMCIPVTYTAKAESRPLGKNQTCESKLDGQTIKDKLGLLLDNANGSYSRRVVACVLETEKDSYDGFNHEDIGPQHLCHTIHAEDLALSRIKLGLDHSPITHIHLAGRGQKKLKEIAPCPRCFEKLNEQIPRNFGTTLLLYDENLELKVSLNWNDVVSAYSPREYSIISYGTKTDMLKEIKSRTCLNEDDGLLVLNLALRGSIEEIENFKVFLTGSASKRGGISNLLSNTYADIDLLIESPTPAATQGRISTYLKNNLSKMFPTSEISEYKVEKPYCRNSNLTAQTFTVINNGEVKKVIEVTYGKNLEHMMDQEYFKRNWFHQFFEKKTYHE